MVPPTCPPPTPPDNHLTPWKGEQNPEEQQQYDGDQYLEEAQGGWGDSQGNTQDCSHPGWDDAHTDQDTWDAAASYSEPSRDADGAQVEQGGWVDGGEAQVGSQGGSGPS